MLAKVLICLGALVWLVGIVHAAAKVSKVTSPAPLGVNVKDSNKGELELNVDIEGQVQVDKSEPNPSAAGKAKRSSTEFDYCLFMQQNFLFYEAMRSGDLPECNRITYRSDNFLKNVGVSGECLVGGYHQNEHFTKFNIASCHAFQLIGWSWILYGNVYKSYGQTQYIDSAMRWQCDFIMKCHPNANTFYAQIGSIGQDYSVWGRSCDQTYAQTPYKCSNSNPCSCAAGAAAALLSIAGIIYQKTDANYSKTCLTHAKQLIDLAYAMNGVMGNWTGSAGIYKSTCFWDDIILAKLWYYKATKTDIYLSHSIELYDQYNLDNYVVEYSWDKQHRAIQCLLYELTQDTKYLTPLTSWCDEALNCDNNVKQLNNGMIFYYPWCTSMDLGNTCFLCSRVANYTADQTYLEQLVKKQIHLILGSSGRSYVVGYGTNPPCQASHCDCSCKDLPSSCGWSDYSTNACNPHVLYGAVVNGPRADSSFVDQRTQPECTEVNLCNNAGVAASVCALANAYDSSVTG